MSRYPGREPSGSDVDAGTIFKGLLVVFVCLVVIIALGVAGVAGCKSFNRSQKRADANNAVAVTHILIRKAEQQAQINTAQIAATKAEAEKRYQEAIGIRRSQDEISKTLTPAYLQHEFIQHLPAARSVFIPTGQGGLPQVVPVNP